MSSSSSSDNNQNVTSEAAAEQAAPDLPCAGWPTPPHCSFPTSTANSGIATITGPTETWFKRPRRKIIGKTLAEALGESAYESIRPHIETVLSGQSVTFQSIVTHGDGTIRLVETSYAPDFDERGDVRGFVAAVTDITGRDAAAIDQTNLLAARQEAADAQQRKFLRDVLYSVTEGKLRLCTTAPATCPGVSRREPSRLRSMPSRCTFCGGKSPMPPIAAGWTPTVAMTWYPPPAKPL